LKFYHSNRNRSDQMVHFGSRDAGRDGLPGLLAALQNGKNP